MTIELLPLLLAAGGGFFGAAIGGLHAFIFTGFMVIAGTGIVMAGGSSDFLSTIAFGPVFGPHVAFAGGVAAAAYAARRATRLVGAQLPVAVAAPVAVGGPSDAPATAASTPEPAFAGVPDVGGKDIGLALVSLERPSVLVVGAVTGMLGHLVQKGVAVVPWFGTHTDTIAVTVVVLAVATRLAFGRTGLLPGASGGARGWGRFAPQDGVRWIKYHERFVPNTLLGAFVGLLAAGATVLLAQAYPTLGANAPTFVFGVSALSLLFLSLGVSFPVTHHITLIAGLAAYQVVAAPGGNPVVALLIGAAAGVLSAWLAELFARLFHNHGDTHFDPPAAAIWPATTVVLGLAAVLG